MRILIAHAFYRLPGGEDRFVDQEVELLGRNHDVELLARRNSAVRSGLRSAARMTYSPKDTRLLTTALDSFRPDVIHVHNIYPAFGPSVHLAARRAGIPLVQTVHNFRLRCPNGYMFTEGQLCQRCVAGNYSHALVHRCFPSRAQSSAYAASLWTHRFILKLEQHTDFFIAPSQFMRDELLKWGIPSQKTQVIRNFSELQPVSEMPGGYGIFLGRLSSEKGIDSLLHALAMAGDPPFKIVGSGPMEGHLHAVANSLSLKHVEFLGHQSPEAVRGLLAASRYLVMPSLSQENAPLAALEAMHHGRPLIVSNRGGLPELVSSGGGMAFEAGDHRQLAKAIRTYDTDELTSRAHGQTALQFARARLTPDVCLAALSNVFDSFI